MRATDTYNSPADTANKQGVQTQSERSAGSEVICGGNGGEGQLRGSSDQRTMATSEGAAVRRVVGLDTANSEGGGKSTTETPEDPVVDGECCVSGVVVGTPPPSGPLFLSTNKPRPSTGHITAPPPASSLRLMEQRSPRGRRRGRSCWFQGHLCLTP